MKAGNDCSHIASLPSLSLNRPPGKEEEKPFFPAYEDIAPGEEQQEPVWLIFLVLLFMFGNPLLDTCSFVKRMEIYEQELVVRLYPEIFHFYTIYSWCLMMFCALVSLYTGYRLSERKEWRSVVFAKWAFWLIGPIQAILLHGIYCLLFVSFTGLEIFKFMFLPLAQSLIWTLAWTRWLVRSPRVREMFPGEEPYWG